LQGKRAPKREDLWERPERNVSNNLPSKRRGAGKKEKIVRSTEDLWRWAKRSGQARVGAKRR